MLTAPSSTPLWQNIPRSCHSVSLSLSLVPSRCLMVSHLPVVGPITHYICLPLILQTDLAPLHTNFHIMPLAVADLVLGDDWLAKYQATLDHARCRIQLTLPLFSPPVTSSNSIPLTSPRHWFSSSTSDLYSSGTM